MIAHPKAYLPLVIFLFLMGSLPAAARDKHDLVPQWAADAAKTPTPDAMKNAAAVILFDEYLITVDEKNHAIERERFVIRILKPQGRHYANRSIGYDTDAKLNFFHSWTIAVDGRQFEAKESDFTERGAYDAPTLQSSEHIRIVQPPANDPGSVVICETEANLRPYMSEEEWNIQKSVPFVFEALEISLPANAQHAESWHNFAPLKPSELGPNHLRWEIHEMPALDLEDIHEAPDWSALAARFSVQWGTLAVQGDEAQWRAMGVWTEELEAHRADPTPAIVSKVQGLVESVPDFYTKLSRITDFIQKYIRYFVVMRGIGGWQAHPAADIFRNGYGDCKDKTTLLIAMLQAAGVHAHYLAVDTHRGFIDPAAPSLSGNHMIAAIELPDNENDPRLAARVKAKSGKTLLIFDPTDEETPVGLIRSELQGAYGNLADGNDSQVLQIPILSPETASLTRQGVFTLSADGNITGALIKTYTGEDAANEREFIKSNDAKEIHDSIEKNIADDLPGVTVQNIAFQHKDDRTEPLELDLHFTANGYAHSAGSLLLVRPRITGSDEHVVPEIMEGKPRSYPIEFGHPSHRHDNFTITLPSGYVVDELPTPVNLGTEFSSYHSTVIVKGNQLIYERDNIIRAVEIPASQAASFRAFENAILHDEKSTVVLKQQ